MHLSIRCVTYVQYFVLLTAVFFFLQELHHYQSVEHAYAPLELFKLRDSRKSALAKEKGITLIAVPCWWDFQEERYHVRVGVVGLSDVLVSHSLVATIKQSRPDLLADSPARVSAAIPGSMPADWLPPVRTKPIEDVGEITTACFMTGSDVDPANWYPPVPSLVCDNLNRWMFEKYDGVRAIWNPVKRSFYSRHGNVLSMPQHMVEHMPTKVFLDGELWYCSS